MREVLQQFDSIESEHRGVEDQKSSTIYIYKMFIAKEKALYRTLNMMRS